MRVPGSATPQSMEINMQRTHFSRDTWQVWVALFLDLWRRRNNEIAFRWGVDGVEDEELMRVQAARVRVPWVSSCGVSCFSVSP